MYSSFFFNDTETTEIYTPSLHDALPISRFTWRYVIKLKAASFPIEDCPKPSPSGAINFTTFVASGGRTHRDSLCGARMAGSGQAPDSDVIFPTMASERTQRQIDRLVDEARVSAGVVQTGADLADDRSEEHTSELQSQAYLVCRLLLEKKNINALGALVLRGWSTEW